MQIYNTLTNKWTVGADFPSPEPVGSMVAVSIGPFIYACGVSAPARPWCSIAAHPMLRACVL